MMRQSEQRNNRKNQSGFSFVELMVAIAIIGILSTIVAYNFLRNLPEKRLKNAARNLYADMQKVRGRAVKENRDVTVRFDTDPADNSYYVDEDGSGDFTAGETREYLADYGAVEYGCSATSTNWNSASLPSSGVTGTGNFTFTYKGTCSPGSVYLQSQNNQDVCYAMTFTNYGAVKLRRFNGSDWE